MKSFYYIMSLILFLGCSENKDMKHVTIKWNIITNTGAPVIFCQIDSISNEYIISYSHSAAISGGFRIMKFNTTDGSFKSDTLFESNKNTTPFVNINDNSIGFVQNDFDENTLRTKFFLSYDLGQTWNEVNTPLDGMRNFLMKDEMLIIEGNLKGSYNVFKSIDRGNIWKKIDLFKKGIRGAILIGEDGTSGKVMFKGGIGRLFSKDVRTLLLLDIEKGSIKELIDFDDKGGLSYIKPISRNKNLHMITDGRKLKIYSLQDEEMVLVEKFRLPNGTRSWIENIYLGDDYYIVTVREDELVGKILSWISYDKGNSWYPFNHDKESRLIYNSFGELFMIDVNNNVVMREY